jgi:signal transduction histidine kinase
MELATVVHIPIFFGEQVLGTLSCYRNDTIVEITESQLRLIELLGCFFGTAIENIEQTIRFNEERNALFAEATATLEFERQTIARNLHDGMGAYLSQLTWLFSSLKKTVGLIGSDPEAIPKAAEICDAGKKIVIDAHAEISRAVKELLPEEISIVGLRGAIEYLLDTWQATAPDVKFKWKICPELDRLDSRKSGIFFRLVQEALTNVMRHTAPENVDVEFQHIDKSLRLTVASKGKILKDPSGQKLVPRMLQKGTTLLGGSMEFEYSVAKQCNKVVISVPI